MYSCQKEMVITQLWQEYTTMTLISVHEVITHAHQSNDDFPQKFHAKQTDKTKLK